MAKLNIRIPLILLAYLCLPLFCYGHAFADDGSIVQVESFIRSVIKALAGLSGLIATGFFIVGGFRYITSSGNPQHLEKAKRTLLYASLGLVIILGSFVLSNIVTTLATNAFGK